MKKNKEPEFFSTQVAHAQRFFIEGASAKSSRVKVACGGWERTRPDFKIDRSDFPYYSLEFVAKGCGTASLASKEFELVPGTIFSYGPGVAQLITNDPARPMTKYFVDFLGNTARQSLQKYVSNIGTAIRTSRPDEITTILDDLIRHGQSDSPYKSMICTTLLEYLFFRIAETTITQQTKVSRAFTTYQTCRQHIKDHFVELNSLQEIANSCAIDHAYLCRLFKRFDTQTPYQYLMNLKMALAAERLQQPGTLVKEVAYELNFDDPFHFSRVFKKVFGISPQSFKSLR